MSPGSSMIFINDDDVFTNVSSCKKKASKSRLPAMANLGITDISSAVKRRKLAAAITSNTDFVHPLKYFEQ